MGSNSERYKYNRLTQRGLAYISTALRYTIHDLVNSCVGCDEETETKYALIKGLDVFLGNIFRRDRVIVFLLESYLSREIELKPNYSKRTGIDRGGYIPIQGRIVGSKEWLDSADDLYSQKYTPQEPYARLSKLLWQRRKTYSEAHHMLLREVLNDLYEPIPLKKREELTKIVHSYAELHAKYYSVYGVYFFTDVIGRPVKLINTAYTHYYPRRYRKALVEVEDLLHRWRNEAGRLVKKKLWVSVFGSERKKKILYK